MKHYLNKHTLLAAFAAMTCMAANAQEPVLEKRNELPVSLLQNTTYDGQEAKTTRLTSPEPGNAYTLEVKGKFNSGTGRGLDVRANDASGRGFRVSMDASTLNWSNPVTTLRPLSQTDNTKMRTLRFAVADKQVSIFEDGYLLTTRPLETISEALLAEDDAPDLNPEVIPAGDWGTAKPTPAEKGWYIVNNGTEVTSWPNARYETSPTTQTLKNNDGSTFNGNFFFIRWDGDGVKSYKYAYEVELAANTTYTFSMDCAYWSNGQANTITVGVSDDRLLTTSIASHVFGTSSATTLVPGEFSFTTTRAGKYYISFSSTWALYAIANLRLTAVSTGDMTEYAVPAQWETKPTPAEMGWALANGTSVVASWPNARYETSPTTLAIKNSDGTTFEGNFFLMRWDGNDTKDYYYTYPVYLQKGVEYTLDADAASYSNFDYNKGTENRQGLKIAISADAVVSSELVSAGLGTGNNDKVLRSATLKYTPTQSGAYYVAVRGAWGLFAISRLAISAKTAEPLILIGKDYEGEASVEIEYASFDGTGAYAPEETTGETTTVTLADAGNVEKGYMFNSDITVSGETSLHLTGDPAPFTDTKINLTGEDAWLYFDYAKPSKVISDYLASVSINGAQAESEKNCRITVWANGAVVIPGGQAYDSKALVAYDGENFTGNSKEFEINTYHNDLGEWDNKIRSFKLKKGYMATLANNANGTGYSRVFIADDEDLEVATLPEGMEKFVSFVRVFRWNWVSKKGKASGYGQKDQLNLTCYYDWNVGGTSTDPDMEYSPIRQNLGWPGWTDINNKQGVTHLLGQNEPDRPDQANATVDQVIEQWPEMFKSGLRLGSPAPSSVWTWVGGFFNVLDSLNYRCDFAVAHIYESTSAAGLVDRINTLSNKGKGRPVWITEWNNGANWTTESWPTSKGPKCDANSNIIYDENGQTTEVNRPLSPENAEKQRNYMAKCLPALDECATIERYFEYDWVQDCRALLINDELTPAGKVYGEHKAALAYRKANAYDHVWQIAPPFPLLSVDNDYRSLTLKWYDHNGETGKKYILERRKDDETEFTAYKEFVLGTDYQAGETVTLTETIDCDSKVEYRIKAVSYKDTESIYSRIKTFVRDAAVAAPALSGEAISTSIIRLSWDAVSGAKSYRIERADAEDGQYEVIADDLTTTSYDDEGLSVNTTYYYRAYSLNSSAERPASAVLKVTTKAFAIPSAMTGVRISGGADCVSLRWDFSYDTYYKVSRATRADGEFVTVAEKVDATRYVDENLTNGLTYYYKVLPFNEAGDGEETGVLTATPEAGKYLHVAFDENEGETSYDEWGCWDAAFRNEAAFSEGRNDGHAVTLVKGSKSYVELPEGVVSRLTDFTIAFWMKTPGGRGRIFDFGHGSASFMCGIASSSGFRYKITCEKGTFDYTAPMSWSTTEWHHVVMTQNGTEMKFYLNGEEIGASENTDNVCPKDLGETPNNWLGRSQWSSDAYCDHVYDDFRIYNRAISADDVKSLYEDKELSINPQYARSVNADSWNTICLPCAAVPAEGVTAYTVSGINAEKTLVSLASVETMEAGVPYVFYSAVDIAGFSETGEPVDAPVTGGNGLAGVFGSEGTAVPAGSYVLENNQWRMVKSDETFVLDRFTAYIPDLNSIEVVAVPGEKTISVAANGTTGIASPSVEGGNSATYTLGGIKVDKVSQNDVYIRNGKKVAVGRNR